MLDVVRLTGLDRAEPSLNDTRPIVGMDERLPIM
jgi:hypothetical protein